MGSLRLASAAAAGGRRVAHGLDVIGLGLLMEIVAWVAERHLLSVVELPAPEAAAGDKASATEPTPS